MTKKEDNSLKGKVFSGLVWKFGERILARGVTFIVSLVLARILSPDDYGIIAMVLVFITLADVFVTSGFATSLIRKKDADAVDFSTMFYCSLVCSIIIYIVLFICAPLISSFYNVSELTLIIRVFALRVPLSVYNSIQHAYVSRNLLFKRFFWSTLLGTLISGGVGIVMALLGYGVWSLIGQYFTNTVIDTLVLQFTVPWHPTRAFSVKRAQPLIGYGWKVLAADLSGSFFTQLRNLVIGRFYTTADLAFYNKGQQFPTLITDNVSSSVISVLFPAISNVSDDLERTKGMLRRAIQTLAFIIFPMMIGMAIIAEPMISVVLTKKWIKCVPYLQIMCISYTVSLIGDTSLQTIKAIGRSDVLLKIEFIKKPVYLILLIIGVKKSVLMIALTMLAYSFYSAIVNAYQLKKYVNYGFGEQLKDLLPALYQSILMAIIVYLISFFRFPEIVGLIIQVIIGVGFYVFLSQIFQNPSYFYLKNVIKGLLSRSNS